MSSRLSRGKLSLAILAGSALLTPAAMAQETHEVTDGVGRVVTLPVNVDTIVSGFFPFPSAFFIGTGSLDKLQAVGADSKHAAERSVFGKIVPDILDLPSSPIQGGVLNAEELLKLAPDVYVTHEGNAALEVAERAGVPTLVLDVHSKGKGDTVIAFESWMNVVGQVTGDALRTDELIDYAKTTQQDIRNTMARLDASQKPGALFFARLGEDQLMVNGSGGFGNFWLNEGGATNLAAEGFAATGEIGMEQIYAFNPEAIFITNLSPTQPEDLYENRIPDQDWSHVKAVQNERVYKVPEGVFQWYVPNGDVPMMLKWMAQSVHPELYADYDFAADLKAYYQRFYNYALSDADVAAILKPTF